MVTTSTPVAYLTAFLVDSLVMDYNYTPINEHLRILRVKGRLFNYSLINIHAPTNDSNDEAKDLFYEELKWTYSVCPGNDVKIVMGDTHAKIVRETIRHLMIGKYSLHETTNKNDLRLIDFATGRQMAMRSTYFMHKRSNLQTWHSPDGRTFNQINHCMIEKGTSRTSSN
jgi:hypothetical protein